MSRPVILLALLFTFVGCRPPAADSRLVGTYVATNGEALIFLADTRVLHCDSNRTNYIGFTRPMYGAVNVVEIFAPDTSRFLGTQFQIDTNFTTITVRWRNLRTNDVRSDQYQRKNDG